MAVALSPIINLLRNRMKSILIKAMPKPPVKLCVTPIVAIHCVIWQKISPVYSWGGRGVIMAIKLIICQKAKPTSFTVSSMTKSDIISKLLDIDNFKPLWFEYLSLHWLAYWKIQFERHFWTGALGRGEQIVTIEYEKTTQYHAGPSLSSSCNGFPCADWRILKECYIWGYSNFELWGDFFSLLKKFDRSHLSKGKKWLK